MTVPASFRGFPFARIRQARHFLETTQEPVEHIAGYTYGTTKWRSVAST
jgi:hypothetical protein